MKRTAPLLISLFCLLFLLPGTPSAGSNEEINNVLEASEGVFKAMQVRDYVRVWNGLTSKSRSTIETDVFDTAKKNGALSLEEIHRDFLLCGPVCKAYWDSFLFNFDPATVLFKSSWDIGYIREKEAEVIIKYNKRAALPARLKLAREEGSWKVGLVETFWSRK